MLRCFPILFLHSTLSLPRLIVSFQANEADYSLGYLCLRLYFYLLSSLLNKQLILASFLFYSDKAICFAECYYKLGGPKHLKVP
jgi:hypothetical protein